MNKNISRFLLSAVLLMCSVAAGAVGTKPSNGNGSTGNPYQIDTKEHLLWFADYVNQGNVTACAILTADITVNTNVLDSDGRPNSGPFETWTPIGGRNGKDFSGEFNGQGHTISGLYFKDTNTSGVGLFGKAVDNAHIHDLGIKDSYFYGKDHVGGICGDFASGKIENCWSGATVIAYDYDAGGISGSCWKYASIADCYNIGDVFLHQIKGAEIKTKYGGICGSVYSSSATFSIDNCYTLINHGESLKGETDEGNTLPYADCDKIYGYLAEGCPESKIHDSYVKNAGAFISGEVCYNLNHGVEDSSQKWYQTLGTDDAPSLLTSRETVYRIINDLGKYEYTNSACQHEHKSFIYDAVCPTSTTTGRYGHWHCSHCDKDFLDESCTIPATEENLTVPVAKNNEIWYTTTDNRKLSPYKTDVFDATYNDANNVYERGLGKIVFDADVKSIGEHAFRNCSSLQEIGIPSSVTSIGKEAFRDCSNLQSITIPGSVKNMGDDVFSNCNSLNNVTIGDGAYIGKNAFLNCRATITVHGSLSGVGESAFQDCTTLKSISVKSGNIGNWAFSGCTELISVTLHEGLTDIGEWAFSGCTELISVTLLEGLTDIGQYAFDKCSKLPSITIPGSVKKMGIGVFSGCSSLNNVTIGDGAYIGVNAFLDCGAIITVNGSLSGVGQKAFQNCTALKSISVKSGNIGQEAFRGCTELISVTLHEGLTNIEKLAFAECSKLPSINIPGSVKYMGGYLFNLCSDLKTVTIGDGAYIGKDAFQNCGATITVNGSLSGVGESAFRYCTGLTSVSVGGGNIGSEAFIGCTGLTTVTLQKGVTGIGNKAFCDCSGLKDLTVEWTEAEKIPSIDWSVFDGVDQAKATLYVPSYTTSTYKAKKVWGSFNIYENINFIVTMPDGTKVERKLRDNDEITIDESDIKSFVVTEKLTNVSVTYIRNFANADKWQGWYVPFDVSMADMAQAGFEVAKIYGILLDNSGNTVLAFLKMDEGTVKANTPYVVRPKESGKVTLTTETIVHPTVAARFTIDSAEDTYTIGGIYEQTTTPGNWYAINKDGRFQKMGEGVGLRPFRVWMTIDSREDNPYATKSGMNMMVISKGQIYTINGKNYLAE